jgi:hypothetical protein
MRIKSEKIIYHKSGLRTKLKRNKNQKNKDQIRKNNISQIRMEG